MTELFPCIALLIACVLIGTPHIWRPYEAPKEVWIVLTGMLVAIWWGIHGSSQLPLPGVAVWLLVAMLMLWGLRSVLTKFPQRALWDLATYVSGLVVVLACEFRTAVVCLVIASVLNCVYGMVQNYFRWEPLKGTTNASHFYAIGFIGNENMLGTWLVPVMFLNMWLVQESWLWLLPMVLQIVVLVRTHCKTAMIGVVGGFVWLMFIIGRPEFVSLLFGIFWLGYLLVARHYVRKGSNTGHERMNYWKIAWAQFKKAPVFGVGFSEMQNKVCFLQQELNDKSDGKFLRRENYIDPWPRKCHNDPLQHLVDHGVVGFVLISVFVGGALWAGVVTHSWLSVCLTTALAGLIVCGWGLHTFYILPTNLIFWLLTVNLWKLNGPSEVAIHGVTFLYVAIPVCLLLLTLVVRTVLFEVWFQKFLRTGNAHVRDQLLKWFPRCGMLHDYVSLNYATLMQPVGIVKHAALSIAYYDGMNRLWEAYTNLGSGLMMLGAMQPAEVCYKRALTLWPAFDRGQRALEQLENIMKVMKSGQGVVMHYEQSGSVGKTSGEGQPASEQVGGSVHTSSEPL